MGINKSKTLIEHTNLNELTEYFKTVESNGMLGGAIFDLFRFLGRKRIEGVTSLLSRIITS